MQPRRAFVFQENLSTGANIVLGNFRMNLQSDELVNIQEGWEEFAPILMPEKIRRPNIDFFLSHLIKIPRRLMKPL